MTSIDSLQYNTNPPPLFDLGAMNIFSNFIFLNTFFSLASSTHVSAKNMTKGSFARTISASSFSMHGFPSPRQFQTRQLIATSRADDQPPPLNLNYFHHPLNPISVLWLTPYDQHLLFFHKPVCPLFCLPLLLCLLVFSMFLLFAWD